MAKAKTKEAEEAVEENAVVETAGTEVSSDVDNLLDQYAGAGQEDIGAEDMRIPRLGIIQSLSPQRSKSKPEFIEGCYEGQVFDNITNKLWEGDTGIDVLVIKFQKVYNEWVPRDSGGGLAKSHGKDPSAFDAIEPDEKGRRFTEDKNEIIQTHEYFLFIIDKETGDFSPAVLSMAKTQIKHSKRLTTMLNQERVKTARGLQPAPSWWRIFTLSTVPESNDQGEWFRWDFSKDEKPLIEYDYGTDVFKAAAKFYESVVSGDVKVAEENEHTVAGEESDDDPM